MKEQGDKITFNAEIKAYQHNIITFLRLHRAVGGGVSPKATQHLNILVKYGVPIAAHPFYSDVYRYLAVIHGQKYVSPSIVALAIRKIYPHRITITGPETERSLQYGSDLEAVSALLEGYNPSQVIEEVLASVDTPV